MYKNFVINCNALILTEFITDAYVAVAETFQLAALLPHNAVRNRVVDAVAMPVMKWNFKAAWLAEATAIQHATRRCGKSAYENRERSVGKVLTFVTQFH